MPHYDCIRDGLLQGCGPLLRGGILPIYGTVTVHWRITGAVTGPVMTNLPVTRVTGPVTRYGQVTGP